MHEDATVNNPITSQLLPAQAFVEAHPHQLHSGALFKFRGFWAMRVAYSDAPTDQAFLILQGPNAGQLHRTGKGMARALCVASSFTWFAALDPGDPARSEALHSASLAVAGTGPVIVGGDTDGDHYAFDLAGQPCDDYRSQAAMTRFDRWSAQLALKDDPFRSLGTIFKVDRRSSQSAA